MNIMFIIAVDFCGWMGNKQKGSSGEREVIHLFWKTGEWTACRVAGSGSMKYPSPDILAHKPGLSLAIECKMTKANYQYLEHREVEELRRFAELSGARPLVAVRFSRSPWRFVDVEDLDDTGSRFGVSKVKAELRGLTFEELTKGL